MYIQIYNNMNKNSIWCWCSILFIKLIKIKRNKRFCIILFLYCKTLNKLTKLFSSVLRLLIWIVLLICFEIVKLKILHSEEKNITLSTWKISHQLSLLLPLKSNHFSVSLNAHKSQLFCWTITEKIINTKFKYLPSILADIACHWYTI